MNDRFFRGLSLVFAAGCLGALVNSVIVWLCGNTGLTAHFHVKIAPAFTAEWLYPRIIWGGIWGALFMLPFMKRYYFFRGLLYSLIPTFVQLFILMPFIEKLGFMGTMLGDSTPIFVLLFNVVWGMTTGLWLQFVEK